MRKRKKFEKVKRKKSGMKKMLRTKERKKERQLRKSDAK